jgi:long-chain acyl-CoA synthetase
VELLLIVDGPGASERVRNLGEATAEFPSTPITGESLGAAMLYSSGTTGRPKGVLRPLPDQPPAQTLNVLVALSRMLRFREGQIYLSPAPLYHSAPLAAVSLTVRNGGTVIVMERFDPERFLELVEKHRVTHTQLVPTMFSRMLKLPADVRHAHDLSSLEVAIHAAAPCPAPVKQAMIDWWGPIILEYYGATEGLGFTLCDSAEWLTHPGTIGKAVFGELHVLNDSMGEVRTGQTGKLWFKTASPFEYFNDPVKTAEVNSSDRTMSTVGDIGYVDEEGYVYLTDRAAFMIISGGVNIYPQECENLLITHPKVADAAVFGVPNEEMGEEVKAVVQLMPTFAPGAEIEAELIAFCREHLAHQKCPRSIDFEAELPRLPTGKLYKVQLRERYWKGRESRIV